MYDKKNPSLILVDSYEICNFAKRFKFVKSLNSTPFTHKNGTRFFALLQSERCFLWIFLCLFSIEAAAQSKPKILLMKERKDLEGKIILINKLLSETASKKEKSRGELAVVNQQLELRKNLITTLEKEIETLDSDLIGLEERICLLQEDLLKIRKNYGSVINITYRNFQPQTFWLAVFSADSFREAFRRMIYFRQFSAYRKNQIRLIKDTETKIGESVSEIEKTIQEKSTLIEEKSQEMERLQESKSNKIVLYTQLRNKENEYRNELELQRLSLKNVMDNLKTEDTPISPKVVGKKGKDAPQKSEYDPTGKDFKTMKGKLPWPVPASQAVIIEKFGQIKDEFDNDIQSDGIRIRTAQGQPVAAIYEGKVVAVMKVPLSGMLVIVTHGKYRSAYTNLTDITVKPGDSVKTGQVLGKVKPDTRTDECSFQFLIHHPPDYLNPLQWLAK